MSNTKQPRPQLALATWANKPGDLFNIGRRETFGLDGSMDSFWIELRHVDPSDSTAWLSREAEAARHLGLYVWMSASHYQDKPEQSWSVEFKLHEVHSADVREAERMLKLLKHVDKRTPARFADEPFELYLPRLLHAVGVKLAIQYHGINQPDTLVSVASVLPALATTFAARLSACVDVAERKRTA